MCKPEKSPNLEKQSLNVEIHSFYLTAMFVTDFKGVSIIKVST